VFTRGGRTVSKKTLSLEDIESTMALDLPDRDLMSWLAIVILDGVELEYSFDTEVEAENFCVQYAMYNSGTMTCNVTQKD
jgi:hypothetical protein